jgi:hypothetical protein
MLGSVKEVRVVVDTCRDRVHQSLGIVSCQFAGTVLARWGLAYRRPPVKNSGRGLHGPQAGLEGVRGGAALRRL